MKKEDYSLKRVFHGVLSITYRPILYESQPKTFSVTNTLKVIGKNTRPIFKTNRNR